MGEGNSDFVVSVCDFVLSLLVCVVLNSDQKFYIPSQLVRKKQILVGLLGLCKGYKCLKAEKLSSLLLFSSSSLQSFLKKKTLAPLQDERGSRVRGGVKRNGDHPPEYSVRAG
jgi:hypothetical protein